MTCEPSLASLRLLILIHELGGVSAAARRLGISQPRASRMIASLEADVGVHLVERGRLGSTLTAAGVALLDSAAQVLSSYERLAENVSAIAGGRTPVLHLAASRTIGEQLVPWWTRALSATQSEVSFRVDNSARVMELVTSGAAAMGFVEGPEPPDGFAVDVFRRDPLVLIVPPHHAWASTPPDAATVEGTRLVEREVGSGVRSLLDVHLPDRPAPLAEFDSNTAILHAVAAGAGPAFLSRLAVAGHLRTGAVAAVNVAGLHLERPLCAIWLPGRAPSALVSTMLRLIHDTPIP